MARIVSIAGVLFFAMAAAASWQASAAAFDGRWSVLIITEKGRCDRGYRYEIAVGKGKVTYVGEGSFNFSGSVTSGGAVKVAINQGSHTATGNGRLTAKSGYGTWRGHNSSGECSGRWEAERR